MTKVSIVTAVYNREETIGRTIQSVQSQTHPDIEHQIVDGASKDGTLAVVERLRDGGTVVTSEPDKGIYDALNKGIQRATGEIIGILHSDDVFAHDRVIARVAELFEDSALDAVYADLTYFKPEEPGRMYRRFNSGRFRPGQIGWGAMLAHPTLFMRRRVFDRFGLYRTDYRIAADFEYVARTFGQGHLKAHYEPDVWVHMQAGGISTSGLSSFLLSNREMLRACKTNGIRSNYAMIASKYAGKLLEYVVR